MEVEGSAVATEEVRAEEDKAEVRVVAAKEAAVAVEMEGGSCRECMWWHLNGNSARAGPCIQRSCSRWSTCTWPGQCRSQMDRS